MKPQAGEYWMTEKGGVVGPLDKTGTDWLWALTGFNPIWKADGAPINVRGYTAENFGPLTHRCNPDGTRYKAPKDVSAIKLPKPVKPINYQRLALSMSKAKTIKQAREIYQQGAKVPAKKGK